MVNIEVNAEGFNDWVVRLKMNSRAGGPRLETRKVNEIKRLCVAGMKPKEIHETTGAALSTIWKVKRGFYD